MTTLVLSTDGIPGVVYTDVFVVVGFGGGGLPAQVTRVGPLPTVDPHVVCEVV